jgi:hypothetical protein
MMSYPVKIFIPFLNHSMQQNFLRNASKLNLAETGGCLKTKNLAQITLLYEGR